MTVKGILALILLYFTEFGWANSVTAVKVRTVDCLQKMYSKKIYVFGNTEEESAKNNIPNRKRKFDLCAILRGHLSNS